jgi:toxin ParE1/3/4
MRRLTVTAPAHCDLEEIQDYIARDKPAAATRLIRQLRETFKMLAQRPFLGEARNDLRHGLRQFSKRRYVIFYEFDDARVSILRVLHGARDAAAIFAKDQE